MLFQVVHPIAMTIDGDSFKDAVKNFVKLNYDMNLASIIITDQARYMKANLNYFSSDNKDKVGIRLIPTVWPLGGLTSSDGGLSLGMGLGAVGALAVDSNNQILSPLNTWPYSPTISYDTKEYAASTFMDVTNFVPKIVPVGFVAPSLGPLVTPLAPLTGPLVAGINPLSPMLPTVISYGKKD